LIGCVERERLESTLIALVQKDPSLVDSRIHFQPGCMTDDVDSMIASSNGRWVDLSEIVNNNPMIVDWAMPLNYLYGKAYSTANNAHFV
jgi:hypothetical protein